MAERIEGQCQEPRPVHRLFTRSTADPGAVPGRDAVPPIDPRQLTIVHPAIAAAALRRSRRKLVVRADAWYPAGTKRRHRSTRMRPTPGPSRANETSARQRQILVFEGAAEGIRGRRKCHDTNPRHHAAACGNVLRPARRTATRSRRISGEADPADPVPFPAGGAVDIVARVVAAKLADDLGKPVVIENKAGAGGIIATDATAKAAARRLHAASHHAEPHHQRGAAADAALRHREGHRAGVGRGRGARGAGQPSRRRRSRPFRSSSPTPRPIPASSTTPPPASARCRT